jgi:hypothetical protein
MDFDRNPPTWLFLLIGAGAFLVLVCGSCCGVGLVPSMRRGIRRF